MRAEPATGDSYRQEYYAGQAEDEAQVLRTSGAARVPAGRYDGVLVTRDFTRLEPAGEEKKYYAPGVGLVLAVTVEDGQREELVKMTG
jgi:hypothetical protein